MSSGISDSSLPLQKAVIAKLKADAGVAALVSGRVFDSVSNATLPYISWGPEQVLPEQADEYDGSVVVFQIDAWDAGPGRVQVKKIARAVRAALDELDEALVLEDNQRVVSLDILRSECLVEQDGTTLHEVMVFQARTEPTA